MFVLVYQLLIYFSFLFLVNFAFLFAVNIVLLKDAQNFRGFLVQARSIPDDQLIGTFTVEDTRVQQTLDCDDLSGVPNEVRET